MSFTPNKTLAPTIFAAAREKRVGLGKRMALRIAFSFASDEKLKELEQELTYEAVAAGAIPPGGTVVDGIYVGGWQDLFQWIIDNWDSILKMIMAIIGLFAGPAASLLVFLIVLGCAGTASAQCTGGVCRPRVLIERKVERTVERERPLLQRQPVRKIVHRERFLLYRRVLRHHGG